MERRIEFLEHVNKTELIVGIVAITVAFVYQEIWVAVAVVIVWFFMEAVILVEINTAESVEKLRKQNAKNICLNSSRKQRVQQFHRTS